LTIADRIAKEHGGAIFVESIPGSGSKFTVELPVQPRGEVR
jgi:signal transduction histidine kinase